jgi:hypothetical protein
MRSIEEIRDAFTKTLDTSNRSRENITIVDDAIAELAVKRETINTLLSQVETCKRIIRMMRDISTLLPADKRAQVLTALAPINDLPDLTFMQKEATE